jgi:hypothetical protein
VARTKPPFVTRADRRNGPPLWNEGIRRRPAQSAEDGEAANDKLIKQLRRKDNKTTLTKSLARYLKGCTSIKPCWSPACKSCGRAVQRAVVRLFGDYIDESFHVISIVTETGQLPEDSNAALPIEPFKEEICAVLQSVNVSEAFGGIDISMNEHLTADFVPHWQLQAWLFVRSTQAGPAVKALRKAFPKTQSIPKPVHGCKFDGDPAGIAYALKPNFDRRITLPATDEKRRNTRDRPLRSAQAVKLALLLDLETLTARLILHGVEIIKARHGFKLRPIKN